MAHKEAEKTLWASELKYRTLFEKIQDGIYSLDSKGRFTYVNEVISQRFGKPEEWFIGKKAFDILRKEDRERAKQYFEATMNGENVSMQEMAYPTSSGGLHWVEVNTAPIIEDGKIVGIFGVSRDITDRKKKESIQNVMFGIASAANTTENIDELFTSIKNQLSSIIDTTNFFIALYDEEANMISLPYFIDEKDDFTSLPAGKTFTSYVIRNDKPILITGEDIDELVKTGGVEIVGAKPKIWVGIPLKHGNSIIGALVLQSYKDRSLYSLEDFEVLKFVSNQIALSIVRKRGEDAIVASEGKYRDLFNFSNDAIFIHDLQGNILDVNHKATKLLGYPREELLKLRIPDLHPPETLKKSKQAFKNIKRDGAISMEIEFLRKNGSTIATEVSSNLITIDDRTYVQGIVRDITGRKNAAEELKQSEEKFRILSEHSPNMIFINYKGRIEYVNEKCVDIMGYSKEEYYDPEFDFFTLIAPESLEDVRKNFMKQMQGQDVKPHSYKIKTKDDQFLDAYINSKLIPYKDDMAILGIVTDVSDFKNAERSLKESEERYRSIFESTKEGILILDQKGVIISANPGAATILGYPTPEELVGISGIDLLDESPQKKLITGNILIGGNFQDIELRLRRMDGIPLYVLSTGSSRIDHDGQLLQQQLVFMDITERKQAEEDMRRQLMKFSLEEGNIYLIKESNPKLSLEAFKDLIHIGYHGVIISRLPKDNFTREIEEQFEYLWLAEKPTKFTLDPAITSISQVFETVNQRDVVYLDRLDYVIFKNDFRKTRAFIHQLRDLVFLKGIIVILSIDPDTVTKDKLRLIEKECKEIQPQHKKNLSDDLYSIMEYVYRQNTLGVKPSYSGVGKEVGVSKPTIRKRIHDLIIMGYLREDIKGRNKALELTDRGRQFFWK